MPMTSPALGLSSALIPDGFRILVGPSAELYIACKEELASAYAVRVVSEHHSTIARRVPQEALAIVPDAQPPEILWKLDVAANQASGWTVLVHRPFGDLIAIPLG
jgi:hypothetical protein